MNDWERLGIEPTPDASVIKKAYAKQLKLNHPEDDPQGYQELREAYNRLLKYVKQYELNQNAEIPGNPESRSQNLRHNSDMKLHQTLTSDQSMTYSEDAGDTASSSNDSRFIHEDDADRIISEFFDKVHQLYQDFFQRLEFKNWEELLNSVIIWNLDTMEIVNRRMLEFLSMNYLLPRNIWKYLNRYFEWSAQEEYIRNTYNAAFADYLFLQIGNERVLRYCYFDRRLHINYEEYVYYRESAFMALLNYDFKNAEMYLYKAAALYSGDPDLHCLWGEFYMRTKDYQRAEYEFQAALAINSNDIYIHYYKANIYYNAGLYMEALKICNMISNSGQYSYELLTLAGKCYLKTGNLKKAERIFLDNLRINPSDSEVKECLAQIINQYLLYIKKFKFALGKQMRVNKIVKELRDPRQRNGSQSHHIDTGHLVAILLSFVIFIVFGLILIVNSFNSTGAIAAVFVLFVRFLIKRFRKDTR